MKVLFILHLPPPVHGAAMVGRFIKDSSTINAAFDCRYINLGTSANINEIGKKSITKFWRYIAIFFNVLYQLIKFRPNLCYMGITVNGMAFYKDALIAMGVKLFGIKLVYHLHNKGISKNQNKWFNNLLYRYIFKNSEAILLSKYLYPDIQKYLPEEQVHYCPNGIPPIQINGVRHLNKPGNQKMSAVDNLLQKRKTDEGRKVEILFLSNLIKSKGVFVLLEACKLLHKKQLPFICKFVGANGDIKTEELQKRVNQTGLTNHVHYAGKKYGKEKEEIFLQADIFAFPTFYHNECFPLVLLEAMQYGLPVISTFEGGIRDIVDEGETGFLVPQHNITAFAEKLEQLITNPSLRKEMGIAGLAKYKQKFTLNAFESELSEILLNF